jgi:hypothetical protein
MVGLKYRQLEFRRVVERFEWSWEVVEARRY